MKNICPSCDSSTELVVVTRTEEFEVKGEKLNVEISLFHCNECGNEFSNKTLPDPYVAAYFEYRKLKSMVQPNEIVDFRKKYNLSQKELSDILGFGGATLSRYENGSIQDQVHDNVLRLAMETNNFLQLIQKNRQIFDPAKYERLQRKLTSELTAVQQFENIINNIEVDEFSGNKAIEITKIAETVKYLCFNREIFKTKLLKLLFYVDFVHFKQYDLSITGLKYVHLPLGPVPDNYELILGILATLDKSIFFETKDFVNFTGDIIRVTEPPKMDKFTRSEIDSLSNINKIFERTTAKEIIEFSHKEQAYTQTSQGQSISYNFAKFIDLARLPHVNIIGNSK